MILKFTTSIELDGTECDAIVVADYQPQETQSNTLPSVTIEEVLINGVDLKGYLTPDDLEQIELTTISEVENAE